MERIYNQHEWHHIAFRDLSLTGQLGVVGKEFYSLFYQTLISLGPVLSAEWIEHKHRVGQWLVTEFLKPQSMKEQLRILSVGAGLGVVEEQLWNRGYWVDVLECQESSLAYIKM